MAQGRRGHRTSGSTVHRSRHDRVAIVGKSAARLTVDAEPAGTRRELGPLAWLVLEELALRGAQESEAGILTSAAGVRELAAALGISKDTAARGVARLIAKRLVRREIARDSAGRF
jgi:DNA-binding MarR family transcriptional regulator